MIRRFTHVIACLLIGVLVLSACGSSEAAAPSTPRATAAQSIPLTIPTERTTVAPRSPSTSGEVPVGSARFDAKDESEILAAPVNLRIGSLAIEAPIVGVGVEANDELEVPGAAEVGWYEFGPRPGEEEGSAVLAAHVDYNGRPGVFFELRNLVVGDGLEVEFDDGTVRRFEVISLDQYAKDELPFDRVFARSGSPVLTLITCGGDFDSSARSYQDNVVVYAIPV
ncbi:MAG: class F sortase [Actinomycetia bacterium]|nr:class F sortase [Actinomycetes bacterium]